MKTYTFRTIIEPDEKGYHGFAPLLRGVHTVGKTIEEAIHTFTVNAYGRLHQMAKV